MLVRLSQLFLHDPMACRFFVHHFSLEGKADYLCIQPKKTIYTKKFILPHGSVVQTAACYIDVTWFPIGSFIIVSVVDERIDSCMYIFVMLVFVFA